MAEETLAESPTRTFERSPGGNDAQQQVITSTAVLTDANDWRTFFRAVRSDRFATCLSSVFTDELTRAAGEGVEVVAGALSHQSSTDSGRRQVRITTPLTVAVDQRPLSGRLDLLIVGQGQAVSMIVGFSVVDIVPADVLARLGDLLLDRQEAP